MYVDESGDVGLNGSPGRYFVLSGIVVHELRLNDIVDATIQFRRRLRAIYGLKLREEIHASHFMYHSGKLSRIPKHLRLLILRDVLDFQASLPDISIINVVVDKTGKQVGYDVFNTAWTTLMQRFHNTIGYRNFPGPRNNTDYGMLVSDKTDEPKLRMLVRKMRRYNPVPNLAAAGYRQLLISTHVEDPVQRDSMHSYLIQLADVNAYFLQQRLKASKYVRKKGAQNYFNRLNPVLCIHASRTDPQGIVRL